MRPENERLNEALAWAQGRRLDANGRLDPEPHAVALAAEVIRLRALLVRYIGLIRTEEGVDYLYMSSARSIFSEAEIIELYAMSAEAVVL